MYRNGAVVVYQNRGLCSLSSRVRLFSSYDAATKETSIPVTESREEENGSTYSVNVLEKLFGPPDSRLPLPGNLGLAEKLNKVAPIEIPKPPSNISGIDNPNHFGYSMNVEKQARVLAAHAVLEREFTDDNDVTACDDVTARVDEVMECKAQKCPRLLRLQFTPLFPDRNLFDGNLTVINFTQKTMTDMAAWSEEMEAEREKLLESFFKIATEIATFMKKDGFWCDFIDPSSGRPYFGNFTNHTLFETDERYKHFGFDIEDLGCCKVIRHEVWGTRVFIGTLFTNAPLESSSIKVLLKKYQQAGEELSKTVGKDVNNVLK